MMALLRRWWWLPLPALLLCLAWGPALVGPFQFDDHAVIVEYSVVHSLPAWWDAQPGLRALLKLSYALNWAVSPQPFGFHLVNLCIHAANTTLLLLWLRRVLPAGNRFLAPFAALLWCLHPATTEAVTYISGRSVSLSALCMLAALYTLASDTRRAPLWAALFTALAMLVRETAWILPALLWLVEWLRGGDARTAWLRVAPALAVVIAALLFFLGEPHHRAMLSTSLAARDFSTQLWTQVEAWKYFALQSQLYHAPNIDPDLRPQTAATPALLLQLTGLLLAIAVATWHTWRTRSWIAGGVLWFVLLLLPTNSLLPRLDVANDRHLYLPLAGLVTALLMALFRRNETRWQPAMVAVFALALAAQTLLRNLDYVDEVSLWQRTVQQSPQKSRAWDNLGMACMRAGNTACARAAWTRALAINPEDKQAAVNLYFFERAAATQGDGT